MDPADRPSRFCSELGPTLNQDVAFVGETEYRLPPGGACYGSISVNSVPAGSTRSVFSRHCDRCGRFRSDRHHRDCVQQWQLRRLRVLQPGRPDANAGQLPSPGPASLNLPFGRLLAKTWCSTTCSCTGCSDDALARHLFLLNHGLAPTFSFPVRNKVTRGRLLTYPGSGFGLCVRRDTQRGA